MSKLNDPDLMRRVRDALGVDTLDAVADVLGEKRSTVGAWSARASMPLNALIRVSEIANRSLDWLAKGDLRQELQERKQPAVPATYSRPNAGSGVLVATAHVAEPGPLPWMAAPLEGVKTSRIEGGSGNPATLGSRPAALLRSRDAGAVLPLVLSLPEGELGGPCEDYEVIPKHMRPAMAGGGTLADAPAGDTVNLIGEMAFSFEWMKRNLGHTSGQLTSIQVRGDSMSSTLLDGETIVIDEAVEGIEVDGIYVLDVYGRRLVKRVQHLVDGTLVLISDNPSYQRETIPRDRARDVRVIGRMVWPRVR